MNLQSNSERSTVDSKPKRALDAKSVGISNIKSICAHFTSKIDEWKESRRAQSISPSQVRREYMHGWPWVEIYNINRFCCFTYNDAIALCQQVLGMLPK